MQEIEEKEQITQHGNVQSWVYELYQKLLEGHCQIEKLFYTQLNNQHPGIVAKYVTYLQLSSQNKPLSIGVLHQHITFGHHIYHSFGLGKNTHVYIGDWWDRFQRN